MMNVNHKLVENLNRAWSKRATVCAMDKFQVEGQFAPDRPDYPTRMVPFFEHPKFQRLDDSLKSAVLTWGWIGYNKRTIAAEDHVVNPALNYICNNLLGTGDWHFHEAMRQTLVDEHYHTLMHMVAMERTKANREIQLQMDLPMSVTYRRLEALRGTLVEPWERALASVAFATVAEISVNAFLDILADDETIQPMNRSVAQMHSRDEYAHSKVLGEVGKVIYEGMSKTQRAFFVKVLPEALRAFVAQDFSMWEAILNQLEIPSAAEIIADAQYTSAGAVIMRDYSGLHRFAEQAGMLQDMEFDFSGTLKSTVSETH
jgi:alpha-N-dichloroacetyl-p-aminophenylserinol N-oxygenase